MARTKSCRLPLAVTLLVSFSPSSVFELPYDRLGLRWYKRIGQLDGLVESVVLTLDVAVVATAVSLLLGTFAAIGVVRGRFPRRGAVATFLIAADAARAGDRHRHPAVVPLPGTAGGAAEPAAGPCHRGAAVRHADAGGGAGAVRLRADRHARTLGLFYAQAVRRVMVPVLAPSFITGALFGFLASVDNYPVSIFLTDVYHRTLPIQLLQWLGESPDPTIATVSSLIIGLTVVVLVIGDRLVGLNRMAGL